MKTRLAIVLGIRPDIIRAAHIIRYLDEDARCELEFVWSGQHYSDNLKDIFFRELNVRRPDVELNCGGDSDAATTSQIISRLSAHLECSKPSAVIFLGDTNTVVGSLAAAQANIPIVHIEGCMRSYDWRMPEEKYRTMVDHLSDVIYAYLPAYRSNGLAEGIAPERIVVTGNPIVEILGDYYPRLCSDNAAQVLSHHAVQPQSFALLTSHRRENVQHLEPLTHVMNLAATVPLPVLFPASYRTQKNLKAFGVCVPGNVRLLDPIGYAEFLSLLGQCRYTLTDSGTVVEEACILGVPSIQMRRATERPEVYEVGASIRFDPADAAEPPQLRAAVEQVESLVGTSWSQPFGDGRASHRIAEDLLNRAAAGCFDTHQINLGVTRMRRAVFGETNER
jgi:UDP-N-acetylglucosamine 2-epimerase (non-hydrolysing)